MYASFGSLEHWKETRNGNYVYRDEFGVHQATVYFKNDRWGIIIKDEPASFLVSGEFFQNEYDAMERAEDIIGGAKYVRFELHGAR